MLGISTNSSGLRQPCSDIVEAVPRTSTHGMVWAGCQTMAVVRDLVLLVSAYLEELHVIEVIRRVLDGPDNKFHAGDWAPTCRPAHPPLSSGA